MAFPRIAAVLGYVRAAATASLLPELIVSLPHYTAQQMSKTHFRPGWEGEGKADVTNGLILPHKASPRLQPCLFAFRRVSPMGTGGLMSCVPGPATSDMRNGLFVRK